MTTKSYNRRYYLHKRAKLITEAKLDVRNKTIYVSYSIDPSGIISNKYIKELTALYGYSLQITIDR
jgi:hypothetical protein